VHAQIAALDFIDGSDRQRPASPVDIERAQRRRQMVVL
jgi:hypothetical protein